MAMSHVCCIVCYIVHFQGLILVWLNKYKQAKEKPLNEAVWCQILKAYFIL